MPDWDFAVATLANAGPDGGLAVNRAVVRWTLEQYLRLIERDPEPLAFDESRAEQVADGTRLTIESAIKPENRAATDTELPPDLPPADLALLPGDTDEYTVTSGDLNGQRGFFTPRRDGRHHRSRSRRPPVQPDPHNLRLSLTLT